jgi:hypothetical protein
MGAVYSEKGSPRFLRGKIAQWDEKDAKKDAPELSYIYEEPKFDINKIPILREKMTEVLLTKSFVFYDNIYYRYTLNKLGRLKSFQINYRHIK